MRNQGWGLALVLAACGVPVQTPDDASRDASSSRADADGAVLDVSTTDRVEVESSPMLDVLEQDVRPLTDVQMEQSVVDVPSVPACRVSVPPFHWDCTGPIAGKTCVAIDEASDPDGWNNNYLCTDTPLGVRWSNAGPIAGMRCVNVNEPAEPAEHFWSDNYLCVPSDSAYELRWSFAGPIAGLPCINWQEPQDPATWGDNFLCWAPYVPPPVERAFNDIPWRTLGLGVSAKETDNPRGRNAFVVFAGYNINAASARAWAGALYDRWLRDHGVRFVYAVQGPAAVNYAGKEIANRALSADLVAVTDARTQTIGVAAHSSGAYVAAEFFFRLFRERADRGAMTRDRVLYYDLDGDWGIAADPERNLSVEAVTAMRWVYFLAANDPVRGIAGFNTNAMRTGQQMYPTRSEFAIYDARNAGCGTSECVHLSLVNERPAGGGNPSYSDFSGRAPTTWWLDRSASRW